MIRRRYKVLCVLFGALSLGSSGCSKQPYADIAKQDRASASDCHKDASIEQPFNATCDGQRLSLYSAELERMAGECHRDVVSKIKYDSSTSCTSLGVLSRQFIEFGGMKRGAPLEDTIKFERARAVAWSARALSDTGDTSISIW